eukprot:1159154-Lingulodinium_polyedra.AAC.1
MEPWAGLGKRKTLCDETRRDVMMRRDATWLCTRRDAMRDATRRDVAMYATQKCTQTNDHKIDFVIVIPGDPVGAATLAQFP